MITDTLPRERRVSDALAVQSFIVPSVLLFSLVLVRAPALIGGGGLLLLLPFGAASLALLIRAPAWRAYKYSLVALAYVALVLIAVVRGSNGGVISGGAAIFQLVMISSVAAVGTLAFWREPRKQQRARYVRALCWAPVVFVAANVLLHLAGVAHPNALSDTAGQEATTLGLLGLRTPRVLFPLTAGVNGIAPIAAVAFAISLVFISRNERRGLACVGALLSMYVILATDSRGALIFGVLAAALVLVAPRAHTRGFGWIAISLPVLPLVLTALLVGLADTPVAAGLSRSGAAESITTGTGRAVAWREASDFITTPNAEMIFGYGLQGQITSGVSVGYAYLFRYEDDPLSHTVHNGVLQTALDLGWVGAICLIFTAFFVLWGLGRSARDIHYAALLGGTLALLGVGIVEAAPTPAHVDSFVWWLLVVFAALTVRGRSSSPDPESGADENVSPASIATK